MHKFTLNSPRPHLCKCLLHPATIFVLQQSESNLISIRMKVKHLFSYLFAGDGKTHYITEQLKGISQPHKVIIAVNEAFTYMTVIEKLCSLPSDKNGCAIFFNFTVLPPPVSLLLCSIKMCINPLMARFIYQFTQYTSLEKWYHHSNIFDMSIFIAASQQVESFFEEADLDGFFQVLEGFF